MNLPELLKIAEAATQGEWRLGSLESYDSCGVPCRFVYRSDEETANSRIRIYSGDMESTPFDCDADAAHIAAFNPSVAIELIKRLQEAEKEIVRMAGKLAGETLRADSGWQRYEAANKMCMNQQAEIAQSQAKGESDLRDKK